MRPRFRVLRALIALLALATMTLAAQAASVTPARAASCDHQDYFPDKGAVKTVANSTTSGVVYGVRFEFAMTRAQIDQLACWAPYLEIDFHVYGFNLPSQWEGYSVYSNLPGAVHDSAASDFGEQTPATTGIVSNRLVAGVTYYATLWWTASTTQEVPVVNIHWVPSHWAGSTGNFAESAFCASTLFHTASCIFGFDGPTDPYLLSQTWFKYAAANWGWLPFLTGSGIQTFNYGGWGGSATPPLAGPDDSYGNIDVPPTVTEPSPPPPPVVTRVKRTTGPDGVHEVYASTISAVTEAWWYPGGDGVHTDELIHIAQDNIVGFDKANMPDGATQAVYTAVPDGVWETWWRPNDGVHSAKIVTGLTGVRQVIVANAYEGSQFVHRLYLLAQDGPYEVWWKDGGDGVHVDRLNNITGGVTMAAATGPDGAYEVFVATPTWVYELWWFPGGTVNSRTILNVTQGDIRSLSMGANLNGGQLLYTGTSTTAWQSWWLGDNGAISTGTIATGQTNAIEVEKDVYNGTHELYLATGDHVQEYWWNDTSSGGGELIRISQNNITSFDKSDDGAYQQVYTASGNLVYETYWAAGVSPTSNVLFSVTR